MTAGLPNKGQNNKANNTSGSDTPKKTNNNENKKTNASEKPSNGICIGNNIINFGYNFTNS